MKRLLLPLLAALALPTVVNANVDPEVHKLCLSAADYLGCVKAMSTKSIDKLKTAKYYFERAMKKVKDGDHSSAISDFNKVIDSKQISKGNLASAYFNRGQSRMNLNNYSEALSDYNKAILINPTNSNYYYTRGFAKNSLKDYNGAISDYSKAIDVNPSYDTAYFMRGLNKYMVKDTVGSCSDVRTAFRLGLQEAKKFVGYYCD